MIPWQPDAKPIAELLSIEELAQQVRACSEAAAASGALQSWHARVHSVHEDGLEFTVRVSENVARKRSAARDPGTGRDPFAPPYDPGLYVGDLSPTHVALLNKYNVLPDHLLLVTRGDRPQTELLDHADFEAALLALAGSDGLVFYNGGPEAGASQAHKHLQHVPLPLGPGPAALPFSPALQRTDVARGVGASPALPFRHALAGVPRAWWHAPHGHAAAALATWHDLWQALGHDVSARREQPQPYNLLLTREWIWLVPRERGEWHGIAVNALGFAGALLVRDEAQYDRLLRVGPARVLVETAGP